MTDLIQRQANRLAVDLEGGAAYRPVLFPW